MGKAISVGKIGLDLVVNQNQFDKQMKGITGLAKKAGAALAGAFAVKKLVQFGSKCVELGSDLQEVQNVVDVTFPAMSKQVDAFAKSAITSVGISEKMAKQFTGTFGSMAKAFGFTEKQAYDMGTTLTSLAGDVASFYNISHDQAYTKLKSVFTGETESLKDLGVVMSQTALDAYAMSNGYGKVTSAMTEAEKVALRYAFVQDQLSATAGDFQRTSDGWANQVRVLGLQFDSLKATIGQGLIAALTPVVRVINNLISRVMVLANAFKALMEGIFGKQAASTADSFVAAEAAAASTAASTKETASNIKKASKWLAGFDTLQKIGDSGGESSSGSAGSADISGMDFSSVSSGTSAAEDAISASVDRMIAKFVSFASGIKQNFLVPFAAFCGEFKGLFLAVWNEGIKPTIDKIAEIFLEFAVILQTFWNTWAGPIFENIKTAFLSVRDILYTAWEEVIRPIWENFMITADALWTNHLAPLVSNFLAFVGEFVNGALRIFNEFVSPLVQCLTTILAPIFKSTFDTIFSVLSSVFAGIADIAHGIITIFRGIVQFLTGVFTGSWKDAWAGVQTIFKGVFESFVGIVKTPLNIIIDLVNGMINRVASGINSIIRAANSISFDLPKWAGGGHVGFNFGEVSAPNIPKLAEGGYVEANTPRLAMIGDNRHHGEIVAPEDKLQAIVDQAVSRALQFGGNAEVVSLLKQILEFLQTHDWAVELNCKGSMESLIRMLYPYIEKEARRRGMQLVK